MRRFQPGEDWLGVMIERSRREGRWPSLTRSDARLLLRVVEENPRAYVGTLSELELAYAREILEAANRWAHFEDFTYDSARRVLDTVALLLRATGSASEAGQVHHLLAGLRRQGRPTHASTAAGSGPAISRRREAASGRLAERTDGSLMEFRNRDADYLAWVAANPGGYVLNTGSQGGGRPCLHQVACDMITKVAPFTSGGHIKVCSRFPDDLDQWALDRGGSIPCRCGLCRPPGSHLSSSTRPDPAEPTAAIATPTLGGSASGWRVAGPSECPREVWLSARRYIPFDKLSPESLAARTDLRRRLRSLRADQGEILEASYSGPKPSNADVENLLLYNIDTAGGCFREAARYGIRFEKAASLNCTPTGDTLECFYRYRLIRPDAELGSWHTSRLLTRFAHADLGQFPNSKRLEQTWAAIHRANSVVIEHGVPAGTPFALFLKLEHPRAATAVASPELVKALIDGTVAAFQAHSDHASVEETARRISASTGQLPDAVTQMLTNAERAVLGHIAKLAFPRADGVQWNPGDHACMAGQVTCEAAATNSWQLSGHIYELQPIRTVE